MIHYLARAAHAYTIAEFLDSWGPGLADRVAVLPYERLDRLRAVEPGVYVFADLERLTPWQRALAARFHRRLAAAGPAFRTLNHPRRTLGRHALLRALHDAGINDFRALRPVELAGATLGWTPWGGGALRYPVFLRLERDHTGSLTALLPDAAALGAALLRLTRHPLRLRRRLLAVEFADVADARGVFHKRSALRIGATIVPRHVFRSRTWQIKYEDLVDAETVREEEEFLDRFPERERVRAIFDLARVDFGRIDYSVRDDRLWVWEINTNPVLVPPPARVAPARLAAQRRSAARTVAALEQLAAGSPAGPPRPRWRPRDLPLVGASRATGFLRHGLGAGRGTLALPHAGASE